MSVSSRHTSLRLALLVGTIAIISLGGHALAQNGSPPVVRTAPQDNNAACCNIPQNQIIQVPGVRAPGASVVIDGGNAGYGYSTFLEHGSSQGSVIYNFRQNGYAAGSNYDSTTLNNLKVEGETERYTEMVTEKIPVTEDYCAPTEMRVMSRPVQAVCIDDRGAPHPASQISGDESVSPAYNGEIFRCMAGTSMQVTVGSYETEDAKFDGGRTFSCQKGEALTHKPGGELVCSPQKPMRNCNERSLLRRYGPGIKSVEEKQPACIPSQRTVMKEVTREVEVVRPVISSGTLVLDGGVGNY